MSTSAQAGSSESLDAVGTCPDCGETVYLGMTTSRGAAVTVKDCRFTTRCSQGHRHTYADADMRWEPAESRWRDVYLGRNT